MEDRRENPEHLGEPLDDVTGGNLTPSEIGALSPRVARRATPIGSASQTAGNPDAREGPSFKPLVPVSPEGLDDIARGLLEAGQERPPRHREVRMHIIELEAIMEDELAEAVQRHYPLDWKEDAITHDLLIRWRRNFQQITLSGVRYPVNLEWEIYKLHGRRETAFGDIGVLVRYRLASGTDVEGAGFLEAKVRARDSTKFPQVRHEQVSRLLSHSRHARLLLYDYHAIPVLDVPPTIDPNWNFLLHHFHPRRPGRASVTHGATVPMELAAAVNQFDDGLYRFAHSLSHQFTRRYLQLHDLDFADAAIQTVKGFPATLGSPNFVLVLRAAVLGQELPEVTAPNENLYGRVETA